MDLAPIALFAYCRPEHTRRVLQALSENELAMESELFIFIDGPKEDASPEFIKKIEEVKKICLEKKWSKKTDIVTSPINKGLAKSITEGVTKIVKQYGKIIVLEDDLVTSKYFLQYMNDALNKYANNDEVACISGYIYPVKEKLPETFFIKGADCWGWATWKIGWDIFEPDGIRLLNELESRKLTHSFDFDGSYPYTKMLRDQIDGKNDSWAIRWYASAYLKDKLCLYPAKSLVQNIGLDGTGTHNSNTKNMEVDITEEIVKLRELTIEENKQAKSILIIFFKDLNQKQENNSILTKIKTLIKDLL